MNRDEHGLFIKGHKLTEEIRNKISQSLKGRTAWNKGKKMRFSDEQKQRISDAHKGKIVSEETRNKLRLKLSGRTRSDKTKKKLSDVAKIRQKKLWAQPEYQKKMSESHKGISPINKGVPLSDSTKQKMSINIRKTLAKPEVKQKLIDSHKGQKSFWKGKKMPEELKKRLSESHKGFKHSEETKGKFKLRVGDKASNWKDGISFEPYCHKFNDELKESIRDRDNHICQLCKTEENGRKLAVHHIHYDKKNCEPDLITLCISCNVKVNANRDYYESLFMEMLANRGII